MTLGYKNVRGRLKRRVVREAGGGGRKERRYRSALDEEESR